MIVIDASIIVEILLKSPITSRVKARLSNPGETLHAPALLDLEVAQTLKRYLAMRQISPQRGLTAITILEHLPITRYHHDFLLRRIWTLRENLTAYDAAYVALAEGLNATLLTRDSRIARAPGHRATVEVI